MANDDERYDENEESEYQFTDDQINYDVEAEPEATKTAKTGLKESALSSFNKFKRPIIAMGAFFVLIFVVYRMLGPTPVQPTDFAQGTVSAPKSPPNVPKPLVPTVGQAANQPKPATPEATAPAAFAPSPQTAAQQPAPQAAPPVVPPPVEVAQPGVTTPTTTPQPSVSAPLPIEESKVVAQAPPSNLPPPPNPEVQKTVTEKLAILEEQNSKLQAQYTQKIADFELLNNSTQEKIGALNNRLGRIEASLNKMAQLMEDGKPAASVTSPAPAKVVAAISNLPPPPPRIVVPKVVYVVQAIIPGRAWLKSETGETVTVAEGDSLKGYGRVSKIDPYDGVVEIDTGSKIMTLSYGVTGD